MQHERKLSDFRRGLYLLHELSESIKITPGEIEYPPVQHTILFSRFQLTLSEAHFSAAPTPDMKVSIRVFGVADYESEVGFSKFEMANSIWRTKFKKITNVIICIYGFFESLITNLKTDFQNSKWRIQYGGQNLRKSAYKRYNLYLWVFGVANYEFEVRFWKFKMADSICRTKFKKISV